MNFNEEVNELVTNLKKLFPKKKDLIVIQPRRIRATRLSHVHLEAKSVFPECFIGTKLTIVREVLDRVKLVQNYTYNKPKDVSKTFAHVIYKEMDIPKGDGLVLDCGGSATATYSEKLDGGYDMRITSKIKDLISSDTEVFIEKGDEKYIGSITVNMKDVDPNTMKFISQYMYKVIPEFSIGGEIGFKPVSLSVPDVSFSTRYEKQSFVLSTTVNKTGCQLCLFKQFDPSLRIAGIVNDCYRSGPMTFGLALHKNYPNGSEVKMFVDSQRCGGFTFQKDVYFNDSQNETRMFQMIASTLIDRQRRLRLGFGLSLEF